MTVTKSLREKCRNTEYFLVRIFLYSVQIQENTDQKILRIWTLFTQWRYLILHPRMKLNYLTPDRQLPVQS